MSEQQAEQTSAEPGSAGTGSAAPASPDTHAELVPAAARDMTTTESPDLAPGQAATVSELAAPKADASTAAPKAEAAQDDAASADATRAPGKVMIMSSGERNWDGHGVGPETGPEQSSGMFGQRRLSALAAVVALALLAGAVGAALATAGLGHFVGDNAVTAGNRALEASVARIDADILALKASIEQTSRTGTSQFNKTSDRLDKFEKAQVEPAARLAKLTEAVDKLRAAPQVAPAPVAAAPAPVPAKDVTGSVAPAVAAAPKVEVARLPTVEGWVLRDAGHGSALIEGRQGIFEVYAGDPVPGLGRVDAIRRQDGKWVVVTTKGLIVAR